MRALRTGALAAAVACAISLPATASAQRAADQRYQTWLALFAQGPIHGDLWLWLDVQPRFYDSFEPTALLVRPGLTWRALPELLLTAGYGWTPSWAQGNEPRDWGELAFTDEHRLWEQVIYQPSDRPTGVAGLFRARLEQRFRTEGEVDVGLRLRLMARVHAPITRGRELLVVVWDEAFVGLNDTAWGQRGGFDQNRFFVGLGWQVIPAQLRLELGYTNQWIVRAATDPVNHIAALNAFVGWQ